MPKYKYILTDSTGRKYEGEESASNEKELTDKFREQNKIILSVTKVKSNKLFSGGGKVKMKIQEKLLLLKNLKTLVKVGVSIPEALTILTAQTKNIPVQKMYADIVERIRTGQSFAQSLKSYDYVFSNLFINMIDTGEKSGNLEGVMVYLDQQTEKEYETRKKIISALIYPAVVVVITFMVALGIVVFVMPKILGIFENFDVDMPLPTRILIGSSNFLINNKLLSIGLFFGLIWLVRFLLKFKPLQPFWHKLSLKLPVLGKMLVMANIARFTRTLNSLISAGVPITEGLRIIGNMLDNVLFKAAIYDAAAKVEKGAKIGESLEFYEKLFPPLMTKMISIGEKTGSLETTTGEVADLYEKEVDSLTANLSVALEPVLLVFMGGMVGGIALSIIAPIYQLPNLI